MDWKAAEHVEAGKGILETSRVNQCQLQQRQSFLRVQHPQFSFVSKQTESLHVWEQERGERHSRVMNIHLHILYPSL